MSVSTAVLEQLRGVLVRRAGGYFRNVIREPQVTCAVCCTPCPGYIYCIRCNFHRGLGLVLADQVGCLTYAVAGQQAGYVMRGYKAAPPVKEHREVVALTAILGLGLHGPCAGRRLVSRVVSDFAVSS